MEAIMTAHIFISPVLFKHCSYNIQNKENPGAIYELNKATCNIFNYKQAVNTRYIHKGLSFSLNTLHQCDCTSSTSCTPHEKDIIGRGSQHYKKMNKGSS